MTGHDDVSVIVAYDKGSASPTEIVAALAGTATPTFLVDATSVHAADCIDLLGELAVTELVQPGELPAMAHRFRASGAAGVVTFADAALPLASSMADLCQVRPVGPDDIYVAVDKLQQRRALRRAGMPVPQFAQVSNDEDVRLLAAQFRFPAVLKPRSGSASRHTYRVMDGSHLIRVWSSISGREAVGGFILESMLVGDATVAGPDWGDYVSVESVVFDSHVRHIGVVGRLPLTPPFRETGLFFPATVSASAEEACRAVAGAALQALGIIWGVCHTELKLTAKGPVVIEVNCRLGGQVDKLVGAGSGALIRIAVGASIGDAAMIERELASVERTNVRFQISLYADRDGRVDALHGVDQVRSLPGVQRVVPAKRRGQIIDFTDGTSSETAVVYGQVADHATMAALHAEAARAVTVAYLPDGPIG